MENYNSFSKEKTSKTFNKNSKNYPKHNLMNNSIESGNKCYEGQYFDKKIINVNTKTKTNINSNDNDDTNTTNSSKYIFSSPFFTKEDSHQNKLMAKENANTPVVPNDIQKSQTNSLGYTSDYTQSGYQSKCLNNSKRQINNLDNSFGNHILNNFTGLKGGMENVDKEKIAEKIYEITKNTARHMREEEEMAEMKEKANEKNKKILEFRKNEERVREMEKKCEKIINTLKDSQQFSKLWLHLDMDMFFAAVEIRDRPELKNLPVAVGGMSMISTSNYIARKYGVRSAMPGFIALKLCPHLILIDVDYHKYKKESEKIMEVLREYDDNLESMGLDEAYLDITNYCQQHNIKTEEDLKNFSHEIKGKIYEKTKLTSSIGIAPNKILAKICSDLKKPNGFTYLNGNTEDIEKVIMPLTIRKIPFIGAKTEKRYNLLGIYTVQDFFDRAVDILFLYGEEYLTSTIKSIYGIGHYEHSVIEPEKSISRGTSFIMTTDMKRLKGILYNLYCKILNDIQNREISLSEIKTLTINIITFKDYKKSKCVTKTEGFNEKNLLESTNKILEDLIEENPTGTRHLSIRLSNFNRKEVITDDLSNYWQNFLKNDKKSMTDPNKNETLKPTIKLNVVSNSNKILEDESTKKTMKSKAKSKSKSKKKVNTQSNVNKKKGKKTKEKYFDVLKMMQTK